jgi:hypothetical protein
MDGWQDSFLAIQHLGPAVKSQLVMSSFMKFQSQAILVQENSFLYTACPQQLCSRSGAFQSRNLEMLM